MDPIDEIIERVVDAGRQSLLEHEVLGLLDAVGLPTPSRRFVAVGELATRGVWQNLPFANGVLKVAADGLIHKTELGAIRFVSCIDGDAVAAEAAQLVAELPPDATTLVRGVLVVEAAVVEAGLGRELLVGLRDAEALGPVLHVGLGGTAVETLTRALRPSADRVVRVPSVTSEARLRDKLHRSLWFRSAAGLLRGVPPVCAPAELEREILRWLAGLEQIAEAVRQRGRVLTELEINPLGWAGRWLPLDGLGRLGPARPARPARCSSRMGRALQPVTVGIVGVSRTSDRSVGRIILENVLDGGFPPDRLHVVHPSAERIEGVRCVDSLAKIGEPVDLLVLAVAAAGVPAALEAAIDAGNVGAVLLIAGGMGETEQGQPIERRVLRLLADAPVDRRPVVIGNNSLGMVSRRACFDSLFIPRRKLSRTGTRRPGLALCSQSGAFLIAQLSRQESVEPDYLLSIGNQIDAGAADFVEALAADPELGTIGLYLEGMVGGDGRRLCATTRCLSQEGRDVIVYLAGHSDLGRAATQSHTASVAGDHLVHGAALSDAGALVAEDLNEFAELLELSCALRTKRFEGRRAALLSNAGYELVCMADRCGDGPGQLEAAVLTAQTRRALRQELAEARLDGLVRATNPLDITPMADDGLHERCAKALLDDPNVDVAVLGAVPFTANMHTLPGDEEGGDGLHAPTGYVRKIAALCQQQSKPLCVVVDAGPQYDPLRQGLRQAGVPVLQRGDDAVRCLGRYTAHRLRWPQPCPPDG